MESKMVFRGSCDVGCDFYTWSPVLLNGNTGRHCKLVYKPFDGWDHQSSTLSPRILWSIPSLKFGFFWGWTDPQTKNVLGFHRWSHVFLDPEGKTVPVHCFGPGGSEAVWNRWLKLKVPNLITKVSRFGQDYWPSWCVFANLAKICCLVLKINMIFSRSFTIISSYTSLSRVELHGSHVLLESRPFTSIQLDSVPWRLAVVEEVC